MYVIEMSYSSSKWEYYTQNIDSGKENMFTQW